MRGKKTDSKPGDAEEPGGRWQRVLRSRNPPAPMAVNPPVASGSKPAPKSKMSQKKTTTETKAKVENKFLATTLNYNADDGRIWPEIEFEQDTTRLLADPKPYTLPLLHDCSKNILHYITNSSLGRLTYRNKQAINGVAVSYFQGYDVHTAQQPYHCRITTVEWHPGMDNFFSVGSKHGDLGFYKLKFEDLQTMKLKRIKSFTGSGPGGYITAMKFHPTDNNKFYAASLDGNLYFGDIEKHTELGERVLLHTCCEQRWYCSLDAHKTDNYVVVGTNTGHTHLLSRTGQVIWEKRLHTQKTSHLEFSPCEPNILCSASLDHTVRLWDMRMMNDKSPLSCLHHDKGINSAHFSLTDGNRLLTTDQGDNIRIYRAPFWHLETDIKHPHRFFQHITPIKADWHPCSDIVVCGRFPDERKYPDLGPQRAVDFFDAGTGEMLMSLKNIHYNKITSLCKFNNTGNVLLSAMGYNLLLWSTISPHEPSEKKLPKKKLPQEEEALYTLTRIMTTYPLVAPRRNPPTEDTKAKESKPSTSQAQKEERKVIKARMTTHHPRAPKKYPTTEDTKEKESKQLTSQTQQAKNKRKKKKDSSNDNVKKPKRGED